MADDQDQQLVSLTVPILVLFLNYPLHIRYTSSLDLKHLQGIAQCLTLTK